MFLLKEKLKAERNFRSRHRKTTKNQQNGTAEELQEQAGIIKPDRSP